MKIVRPPANAADPAAGCTLQAARLVAVRLQAAASKVAGARFHNARLRHVGLQAAVCKAARLQGCKLRGCRLPAGKVSPHAEGRRIFGVAEGFDDILVLVFKLPSQG